MYSLTIVFGPGPSMWQLLFKTQEMARAATKLLYDKTTDAIEDDFGHTCIIDTSTVHGYMLEDMEVSKMGHIELALHQARTQAKAQQMGQSDPMLRTAGMMNPGQGPAMLSPMYNGRG